MAILETIHWEISGFSQSFTLELALAFTSIKSDENPVEKQHQGHVFIVVALLHWVDFTIVEIKLDVLILERNTFLTIDLLELSAILLSKSFKDVLVEKDQMMNIVFVSFQLL